MTLKMAMIGTGRIAEGKLLPALRDAESAELWSVLSRDKSRAEAVAREFAAGASNPGHDDLNTLLADPDLDAVIIATPDKLHAEQAIAAAKAGKHVLCEKPMTTSNEDAESIIQACKDAGVTLGVAYHIRWHDGLRRLHSAVHNDKVIGDLRHMRVQWSFQAPDDGNWRAGSDVGKWWGLAGVGTHCLDQILWFMEPTCGDVVEVESLISKDFFKGPNDETAMVSLKFANGMTAELTTSVLFQAPTQFELYGSKGWARGEDAVGTTGAGRMWTSAGEWPFEVVDGYRLEIEDFAAAVRNGREPEATGEMGAKNVQILLKATG